MTAKLNFILKLILLQIIPYCLAFSQGHEKSRMLLDRVSKNMLSKENMNFEFVYKLDLQNAMFLFALKHSQEPPCNALQL